MRSSQGIATMAQITEYASVFCGSFCASAPCYGRTENVRVISVIIPKLELGNIERQILFADFVEGANNAAFEDAPKALNRVRVNSTDDVFVFRVRDDLVLFAVGLVQVAIARPLVGHEKADLLRDGLLHECSQMLRADGFDHAGNNTAFAANRADNRNFARADTATARAATAAVLVVGLTADKRFVNLDNAAKLFFRLNKRGTNAVRHVPSGLERAKAHVPPELTRTHTLLAGQDQMRDLEPITERLVRVLKDRARDYRKAIAVRIARLALPMEWTRLQFIDLLIATARAMDALRPAPGREIPLASIFVADRERGVELRGGHLGYGFGHSGPLSVRGYCHV